MGFAPGGVAFRVQGVGHDHNDGTQLPAVQASEPPYHAGVLDVRGTGNPPTAIAIESVHVPRPADLSAVWADDGAKQILTLEWLVASPTDGMTVSVRVRTAAGLVLHRIGLRVPTA